MWPESFSDCVAGTSGNAQIPVSCPRPTGPISYSQSAHSYAWTLLCRYFTWSEATWIDPRAVWPTGLPVHNLADLLADPATAESWQQAFDAAVPDLTPAGAGDPGDWEVVGRVAYKRTGEHSVRYPDGSYDTVPTNPWELSTRDAVIAAIRLMYMGVPDFADFFLIYGGYGALWANPYGGGDIQFDVSGLPSSGTLDFRQSPDNFLRSLALDLEHDYIFVVFVDNDADSNGWSRTNGVVQLNLRTAFRGSFQPGGPTPDLITAAKSPYHARFLAACESGDHSFESLRVLCLLAGTLAHEIGHKTWSNCFGLPSGISNQYEGGSSFVTFSNTLADPTHPVVPLPLIAGNPAAGGPGSVTRHFVLEWIKMALAGWLWGWRWGMAHELRNAHFAACEANCMDSASVGETGYVVPPSTRDPLDDCPDCS